MGWRHPAGICRSGLWVDFFLDKTLWDAQNSIQIGLGKGGKHLFPSTSQGVNRIQCSCSEDFNKPGFQLETYSQLDLGIGLPLFSCPRNLRGWIR